MASVFGIEVDEAVEDRAALRAQVGEPGPRVIAKVTDRLDPLAQRFIAASPFAVLATRRADGGVDLTPRGDPPGFAQVLSPQVLALPDRAGNRRMDAFENLLDDPRAGLIFMIPKVGTTLRVSGEARIVRDAGLGERMAVNGRPPSEILLMKVERVLAHCSKAFVRSGLWRFDGWADTSEVPTLAEMMVAHGALTETIPQMDEIIERDERERLY